MHQNLPPGSPDPQGHPLRPTCLPEFSGHAKFHKAALDWYRFGLAVIPLVPGTKKTAAKWDPWLNALSTASINRHWLQHPDHEVGFIVGDHVIVFDADSAKAVQALKQYEAIHGVEPLMVVKTRRGEHHYFAKASSLPGKTGHLIVGESEDRIDIKTGRTMVILPPSTDKVLVKFAGHMLDHASDLSVAPLEFIQAFLPDFASIRTPAAASGLTEMKPMVGDPLMLVVAFLHLLDPDMPRDDWFLVAAAVFNVTQGNPEAYERFDSWSAAGNKYKGQRETLALWSDLKPDHPRSAGMGTLFYLANRAGYSRDEVLSTVEPFEIVDGELQ
jgi:hypothetical protein